MTTDVHPPGWRLREDLPERLDLHTDEKFSVFHTPECWHAPRDSGTRYEPAWVNGIPRRVAVVGFNGHTSRAGDDKKVAWCCHCIIEHAR